MPPKIKQPPFITMVITHSQTTIPDVSSTDNSISDLLTSKLGTAKAGQIVLVHESFRLRIDCEIEKGYPVPMMSWSRDGERLINSSKFEVYKNGTLVVRTVTESDEGVYICIAASDGLGADQINTTISIISMLFVHTVNIIATNHFTTKFLV